MQRIALTFRFIVFVMVLMGGCVKHAAPTSTVTNPTTTVTASTVPTHLTIVDITIGLLAQPGYVQVEANQYGTCGRLSNGNIRCWGQLNLELTGDFIDISDTCFLRRSGEVNCAEAELQPLPSTYQYQDIEIGENFACGITTDQHLVCQVKANRPEFASLAISYSERTYQQVAVGWSNGCAITTEGRMLCWGTDYEPGNGAREVNTPLPVRQVSMTGDGLGDVVCAVDTSGTVYCGLSRLKKFGPQLLPPSTMVSVGMNAHDDATICVVTQAGEVKCVGNDLIDMQGPVGSPWTQVSVAGRHVCAVNAVGGIVCGGFNNHQRNNIPWFDESTLPKQEEY